MAVATPASTQPVRLLLAGCAACVPLLGLAAGVVHRPAYAVGAVLSAPLVVIYAYTGLILPWTQLSFTLGQVGLELLLGVPVVGEPAALGLFGGFTLGQATLEQAFRFHYALVGIGGLASVAAVAAVGLRRGPGLTGSASR
nr:cytochrome b N-terminal domain-containing protein [Halobellus ruber]